LGFNRISMPHGSLSPVFVMSGRWRFEGYAEVRRIRRKSAITVERMAPCHAVHIHLASDIAAYCFDPDRLPKPRGRISRDRVGQPGSRGCDGRDAVGVLVGFQFPARRIAELANLRWTHLGCRVLTA
jgi:hypothetical protein